MKCPYPLHLKHWDCPSLLRDRLLSVDGNQPLSVPLVLSHFCSVKMSFLVGGVIALCGPDVGGRHFRSLLGRSSGPNLVRIWSAIQVKSDP